MRVLAPSRALANERDLGLALAHHQALDERRKRGDRGADDLAQGGPGVAEDAGVAVLIRPGRADSHRGQHAPQDRHRVLEARVLGVRLDPLERRLGTDSLDLELGNEHRLVASQVAHECDRSLGREEHEAREVLDVVLVEQDVAVEPLATAVVEEPLTSRQELLRRNAGTRLVFQLDPFPESGPGTAAHPRTTACRPSQSGARSGGKWQRVRAETLGTVPLFGARVPSVSHANDDEERNRPRCAARRQRPRGRAPGVARPHRALSAADGQGAQQDVAGAPRARLVGARARGARRGDSERRVPLSPRVGRRSGAAVGRGEEGG